MVDDSGSYQINHPGRKHAVSEEPTEKLNDRSSFEARVLSELATLGDRLATLEEKVDARLRETRPIWQAVLSRLEVMNSKLDVLGRDLLETRAETELLKKYLPPAA
ncbi:MAG TPA: hypothetical protein VM866_07305 [Pyrinomonadaceae bacterium]|nr:hypothetical protein [Pyrinomonadaceae bacterium]